MADSMSRPTDPFAGARRLIRAGDWRDGLAAFDEGRRSSTPPDASMRLLCAIARLRLAVGNGADGSGDAAGGDGPAGGDGEIVDAPLVRAAQGRMDVRRLAVGPFIRQGEWLHAVALLRILILAYPERTDDRRTLASVLGRLHRWDEALQCADEAATLAPDDPGLWGVCLQLRLLARRDADAAALAQDTVRLVAAGSPDAHLWLTALARGGRVEAAAELAESLSASPLASERVAASVVQSLRADRRIGAAIEVGEAALVSGLEGASLRLQLGLAYLDRGFVADKAAQALGHFTAGVRLDPENLRLNAAQGETLLRTGRYADALAPLSKACSRAPELSQVRSLYARALRYARHYPEAAEQALKLVEAAPDRGRWRRSAAAALIQAGRVTQARQLFEEDLRARAQHLTGTFEQALQALDARLDEEAVCSAIPAARLDWAWSLRGGQDAVARPQWERLARWGYLADRLLLEWLECRQERVEEAMARLDGLDDLESLFRSIARRGLGTVVATAHIGPMYAGLMVLELLGIPSRWVSSTPSIGGVSYATALISTADKSDAQVGRAILRALSDGYTVCLAIDGAPNPAAPRIRFEGQEITYSSFAARAAYRLGVPSLFYAPRWSDGRIVHTAEPLPEPHPGEAVEPYVQRWQDAYLQHLRGYLAGAPENLRLSGGIWRHVRAPEKT